MTDFDETGKNTPISSAEAEQAVRSAVTDGLDRAIDELCELVRIPSVSWDAFDPAHVVRSADAVADLARGLNVFDSVSVLRAPLVQEADSPQGEQTQLTQQTHYVDQKMGQPAVLATRAAKNGRPTIMLYAHHDVQPPGKDEDWDSAPFEPVKRGDRLYGRGAADDKAGVMAHIASIRALKSAIGDDFDLGLVVFIEGEEEFGSGSFANFLMENRDALTADVIVVADSDNWNIDTPALTVALRGNVTFRLSVRTLEHASHSGMFGGAVPDGMMAMIRLLSTLHDPNGSVAVEGLTRYETTTPDYDESQLREATGLLEHVRPIGDGPILSRLWAQPAITVTGIDAPTVANASNTLSPEISVRISARIAPGQDARDAFIATKAHLEANAPFGAKIEISEVDTGNAFLVDTSGWAVAEAKQAMRDAWGVEPVETGVGGSIPFISDLVTVFPEAQILVTGVEDPDSRAHSPNESLHLGVFERAVLTEALLLIRMNARQT